MNENFKTILVLCISFHCSSVCMESIQDFGLNVHQRPQAIQEAITKAYDRIQTIVRWKYTGDCGFYSMLGISEEKIINYIVKKSSRKNIYLIDIGAGQGEWGNAVKRYVVQNFQTNDKHFHVISITGSNELEKKVVTEGNVTLYQLPCIKIETIHIELKKYNLNLLNSADLIVSRWTLKHLVDPLGTLCLLYDLLCPSTGLLIASGFWFSINENITNSLESWKLFAFSVHSLFRSFTDNFYLGDFVFRKGNEQKLMLPLSYSGDLARTEFGMHTNFVRDPKVSGEHQKDSDDCSESINFNNSTYCGSASFAQEIKDEWLNG